MNLLTIGQHLLHVFLFFVDKYIKHVNKYTCNSIYISIYLLCVYYKLIKIKLLQIIKFSLS